MDTRSLRQRDAARGRAVERLDAQTGVMNQSLQAADSRVDPEARQSQDRLGDDFDRRIGLDLDLQQVIACRADDTEWGRWCIEDGDDVSGRAACTATARRPIGPMSARCTRVRNSECDS